MPHIVIVLKKVFLLGQMTGHIAYLSVHSQVLILAHILKTMSLSSKNTEILK